MTLMTRRRIRQVSFNLEDTSEVEMDNYVDQFVFSTYIKRLIFRDMNERNTKENLAILHVDEGNDETDSFI